MAKSVGELLAEMMEPATMTMADYNNIVRGKPEGGDFSELESRVVQYINATSGRTGCTCKVDPWEKDPDCPQHGGVNAWHRENYPSMYTDIPEVKTVRDGIQHGGRKAGKSMAYGNVNTSSEQKPMVTREDYDKARAVLDALPAGYYVKCGGCGGWFNGGNFVLDASGKGPKCERCAH